MKCLSNNGCMYLFSNMYNEINNKLIQKKLQKEKCGKEPKEIKIQKRKEIYTREVVEATAMMG